MTQKKQFSKTPKASLWLALVPSVISAIIYGVIAYYVNREHGQMAALMAALTQAVASALVTYFAAKTMEFMFALPVGNGFLKWLNASLGSGVLVFVFFVLMHKIMGTPNIMAAVTPGLIIGTPYFVLYPLALLKNASKK